MDQDFEGTQGAAAQTHCFQNADTEPTGVYPVLPASQGQGCILVQGGLRYSAKLSHWEGSELNCSLAFAASAKAGTIAPPIPLVGPRRLGCSHFLPACLGAKPRPQTTSILFGGCFVLS